MSKSRLRKKIRRLAGTQKPSTPVGRKTSIMLFTLTFFIGCFTTLIYLEPSTSMYLLESFLAAYRKQFLQIINGDPNYCRKNIDTQELFEQLTNTRILNQNDALTKLEANLRNESKQFIAIGIVGPSGVGKSLLANALMTNFPWKENIQIYSWAMYVKNEKIRQELVTNFIKNLWDCGQNLIIIDDLTIEDKQFIEEYTKNIKNSSPVNSKVIVIYIINLPSYAAMENELQYETAYNISQAIQNVQVINFRRFSKDDIKDCIKREAKEANLTLSSRAIKEILNSVDAPRSGCKNVYSKVLVYGSRR